MKEKLRQQARGQAREKAEAYLKDLSIEEQKSQEQSSGGTDTDMDADTDTP